MRLLVCSHLMHFHFSALLHSLCAAIGCWLCCSVRWTWFLEIIDFWSLTGYAFDFSLWGIQTNALRWLVIVCSTCGNMDHCPGMAGDCLFHLWEYGQMPWDGWWLSVPHVGIWTNALTWLVIVCSTCGNMDQCSGMAVDCPFHMWEYGQMPWDGWWLSVPLVGIWTNALGWLVIVRSTCGNMEKCPEMAGDCPFHMWEYGQMPWDGWWLSVPPVGIWTNALGWLVIVHSTCGNMDKCPGMAGDCPFHMWEYGQMPWDGWWLSVPPVGIWTNAMEWLVIVCSTCGNMDQCSGMAVDCLFHLWEYGHMPWDGWWLSVLPVGIQANALRWMVMVYATCAERICERKVSHFLC